MCDKNGPSRNSQTGTTLKKMVCFWSGKCAGGESVVCYCSNISKHLKENRNVLY